MRTDRKECLGKSDSTKRARKEFFWIALWGGLFALSLLMAGRAAGQTAEGGGSGTERPGELALDPITVTATRTPRRISTVADSIEVISKEQIRGRLPGDLNDALRDAAGGVLEQSGSRGGATNFRIRGSENNFTSVLLDGFKFSSPDGLPFDFGHLSPEWIERVDILRGPQSTLYGSDAAGGVVNILPDVGRPGDPAEFEAHARHGSFSTWEESVKVRGGTERGGYLASASRISTVGRFDNDGYYRTVGTVVLDLVSTPQAKARLLYQVNHNRFDNASDTGAVNTDIRLDDDFTDKELNTFQKNLDQLAGLRLELRPVPWFEYIPRVSIFEKETLFQDKTDILDADRPFFAPSRNDTTKTRYLVDNQVNLRFGGKRARSVATLGFEWEEERFFQAQIGSTVNRRRRARSLYAQEQLTLRRDLTLTAGVRFDDFDVGEDPLTTKFSASYRLRGAGTKIRGAVGEGVKRPSFSDLFGIAIFAGNPNLKSEKQENWEVGVDQDFLGGKMKWTATYFETHLKNLIAFSFGGFPNGTSFENISKVRLKGAEFSAALIDLEDFTLRVNYNTLDTVVLDDRDGAGGSSFVQGEELLRRPDWWWSGSVLYHPDRLSAGVFVNQTGDRRDRDFRPFVDGSNGGAARTVKNPGFTRIDLALAYDLIPERGPAARKGGWFQARRLTAEFRANNILDEDYDELFGFNAPGVSWHAGFQLRF